MAHTQQNNNIMNTENFQFTKVWGIRGPIVETPCDVEVSMKSGGTKQVHLAATLWRDTDKGVGYYTPRLETD